MSCGSVETNELNGNKAAMRWAIFYSPEHRTTIIAEECTSWYFLTEWELYFCFTSNIDMDIFAT